MGFDPSSVRAVSWDVDGTLYAMPQMVGELRALVLERLAQLQLLGTLRAALTLRRYMRAADRIRARGGALEPGDICWQTPADEVLQRDWVLEAIRRAGPRAGLQRALEAVAQSGRVQVVFSDFQSAAKLEALGVARHFTGVYAGEALGGLKPSPVAFERILSDLQLPPAALLHVGDLEDRDGEAARAAGCQCVVLDPDGANLPALIDQLSANPT